MESSRSGLTPYVSSLLAGGLAGTTVDISLYPIDTLKTRLQSAQGFAKSGGFRGVYAGVGSAIVGSAPGAGLFFVTYEYVKNALGTNEKTFSGHVSPPSNLELAIHHMAAASVGEVAACAVRVPTEVVKQRAQASQPSSSSIQALKQILSRGTSHGPVEVFRGLYRGWTITIFREVPFTIIQFPLWEALKRWRCKQKQVSQVSTVESALFGCVSGAIAAASTTPLDVIKTRVMLATKKESMVTHTRSIFRESGWRGFFAGTTPRVTWISIGGAVFLGSYQWALNFLRTPT